MDVALPGLIATSIFTFTLAWNDYIFTRILIASDELKTLPVGVQDLFAAAVVDWGLVMAAGMLITIPALAFFMAVQRHLVAGWGTGGAQGGWIWDDWEGGYRAPAHSARKSRPLA